MTLWKKKCNLNTWLRLRPFLPHASTQAVRYHHIELSSILSIYIKQSCHAMLHPTHASSSEAVISSNRLCFLIQYRLVWVELVDWDFFCLLYHRHGSIFQNWWTVLDSLLFWSFNLTNTWALNNFPVQSVRLMRQVEGKKRDCSLTFWWIDILVLVDIICPITNFFIWTIYVIVDDAIVFVTVTALLLYSQWQ